MRGKSFSSLFYLTWRVRTKQESTEFRAEAARWVFMGWIMQRQSKHSASCRGKKGKFRWQQWLRRFTLGTHSVVTDLYQHTKLPPPSPAADLLQLHLLSQLQLSWASRACPDMSAQHQRRTSSCGAGSTESRHPQCVNQSDHKGLIYLKPFLCFQAVWVCRLNSQIQSGSSVSTLIT